MAGERLIGIECGPRGEMGVSGGRGRTSNTGAGGNRGAAGGASWPFKAPKRGTARVELRSHVLALLRSPRLKAMAMGEGDGKGRLRESGRLSGGGVVAVEQPVRVGVAGRGAIRRCVEDRVVWLSRWQICRAQRVSGMVRVWAMCTSRRPQLTRHYGVYKKLLVR